MSIFRRHNRVRGVRIWKWGTFQIEVWFCPKEEFIEPHVHQRIDSTLVLLAGEMLGTIRDKTGWVRCPEDRFRKFHVPAGTVHSAKIGRFCVFANIERWGWTGDVTSAADDFTAV